MSDEKRNIIPRRDIDASIERRERQEEEREEIARKEATRRAQERADLRWLLSSQQGRRTLWQIFRLAGIHGHAYVDGNPHGTSFNEGRRAVGLDLSRRALAADEQGYALMFAEHVADLAGKENSNG